MEQHSPDGRDHRSTIHLVGGGWSPELRDAVWVPFLRSAAGRSSGRPPRIACVIIDEGPGVEQVQRWTRTLSLAAECDLVPVLIPVGAQLSDGQRSVLASADGLLVCGGLTPAYTRALAGSVIRARVATGVPYAGFSAGAAVAAERAVVGGWRHRGVPVCPADAGEDLDEVTVVSGLGLVPFAIDVHAAQWGTLPRLVAAVAAGQVRCGIALDEDTALQIADDGLAAVVGNGRAHLVRRSAHDTHEVQVRSLAAGAPALALS